MNTMGPLLVHHGSLFMCFSQLLISSLYRCWGNIPTLALAGETRGDQANSSTARDSHCYTCCVDLGCRSKLSAAWKWGHVFSDTTMLQGSVYVSPWWGAQTQTHTHTQTHKHSNTSRWVADTFSYMPTYAPASKYTHRCSVMLCYVIFHSPSDLVWYTSKCITVIHELCHKI